MSSQPKTQQKHISISLGLPKVLTLTLNEPLTHSAKQIAEFRELFQQLLESVRIGGDVVVHGTRMPVKGSSRTKGITIQNATDRGIEVVFHPSKGDNGSRQVYLLSTPPEKRDGIFKILKNVCNKPFVGIEQVAEKIVVPTEVETLSESNSSVEGKVSDQAVVQASPPPPKKTVVELESSSISAMDFLAVLQGSKAGTTGGSKSTSTPPAERNNKLERGFAAKFMRSSEAMRILFEAVRRQYGDADVVRVDFASVVMRNFSDFTESSSGRLIDYLHKHGHLKKVDRGRYVISAESYAEFVTSLEAEKVAVVKASAERLSKSDQDPTPTRTVQTAESPSATVDEVEAFLAARRR